MSHINIVTEGVGACMVSGWRLTKEGFDRIIACNFAHKCIILRNLCI